MLFDRICTRLCLHTRAARIAFFSSIVFIMLVTVVGALYLYEPQAMIPFPAVQTFDVGTLEEEFRNEFGVDEGNRLFDVAKNVAEYGDDLMKGYVFLQSEGRRPGGTLSAREARDLLVASRPIWLEDADTLLSASHPYIRALAEDLEEAQLLALDGLDRWTPFINQRLFRARGMYHDLSNVLLTPRSNNYYGDTRLGRLVIEDGRS